MLLKWQWITAGIGVYKGDYRGKTTPGSLKKLNLWFQGCFQISTPPPHPPMQGKELTMEACRVNFPRILKKSMVSRRLSGSTVLSSPPSSFPWKILYTPLISCSYFLSIIYISHLFTWDRLRVSVLLGQSSLYIPIHMRLRVSILQGQSSLYIPIHMRLRVSILQGQSSFLVYLMRIFVTKAPALNTGIYI